MIAHSWRINLSDRLADQILIVCDGDGIAKVCDVNGAPIFRLLSPFASGQPEWVIDRLDPYTQVQHASRPASAPSPSQS